MAQGLSFILRLLGFTVLQTIVFVAAGAFIFGPTEGASADASLQSLLPVLVLTALPGIAIALYVAGLTGNVVRNAVLIFLVAFGVGTVLTQVESAFFLAIERAMLMHIVILGAVTSLTAAILGVLIFAKGRWPRADIALPGSAAGWIVAATLFALAHVVIYFTLGYYIVWVNDAARDYYGGGELLSFAGQIEHLARTEPQIFLLQIIRGYLYAGFAALIFMTAGGGRLGRMIVTGALFLAFGAVPLLVPNPFMPDFLRHLHFVELSLTMIALAILAGLLFRRWGTKA